MKSWSVSEAQKKGLTSISISHHDLIEMASAELPRQTIQRHE